MIEYWTALSIICAAALASTVGTVLVRVTADQSSLALAVVASSLWSMSAVGFGFASSKGMDLGAAATVMSTVGPLFINAIGLLWFGDAFSQKRLLALFLIVVALVFLASSPSSD